MNKNKWHLNLKKVIIIFDNKNLNLNYDIDLFN